MAQDQTAELHWHANEKRTVKCWHARKNQLASQCGCVRQRQLATECWQANKG